MCLYVCIALCGFVASYALCTGLCGDFACLSVRLSIGSYVLLCMHLLLCECHVSVHVHIAVIR